MLKVCTLCGKEKDLSLFSKIKPMKNGNSFSSWCKKCMADRTNIYNRKNTIRDKIEIPLEKRCSACHLIKPASEFFLNKRAKDGLKAYCKPCERNFKFHWTYGITLEQKNQIISKQNGKCPICDIGLSDTKASLDHNHCTNQIRGVLCGRCNLVLGMVREEISILRSAIKYLENWSKNDNI